MKKLLLAIIIIFSLSGSARAQWATSANDIYSTNTGNVGIGTGTLTAKFNIFQNLQLGTAAQNNTLLSSTTGSAFNNVVRDNVWLVRNTAGNTWSTARIHDGISIDNIFITPQVDTKTWWERDPNYNIQSWGNGANTYLTINNGNVGIGTTTPSSKLQINEVSDSKPGGTVAATKSVFKLSRLGTPNYSYNESAEFKIGHGGPSVWGSQLDLFINGGSNQSDIPDQQVMTWLYNGNVGIGITTPASKLHIFNQYDVNATTALKMFYQGTWGTPAYATNFRFIDLNSTESGKVLQVNGTGMGIGYDPPAWSTADKLYVNGNVGIGTTDPKGYMLAVAGSAIAASLTIKTVTNWPDYVFKKDYQLPSLSGVKAYIDQNQHLPEVPSEQQIAKDGLNLGEMNKLLIKKVEELTLYLIDQDKENNDQQKQINDLKHDMEMLKKSIHNK